MNAVSIVKLIRIVLGANTSSVLDTPETTDLCAQRFLIIF